MEIATETAQHSTHPSLSFALNLLCDFAHVPSVLCFVFLGFDVNITVIVSLAFHTEQKALQHGCEELEGKPYGFEYWVYCSLMNALRPVIYPPTS